MQVPTHLFTEDGRSMFFVNVDIHVQPTYNIYICLIEVGGIVEFIQDFSSE
jgi:hypothetical protein